MARIAGSAHENVAPNPGAASTTSSTLPAVSNSRGIAAVSSNGHSWVRNDQASDEWDRQRILEAEEKERELREELPKMTLAATPTAGRASAPAAGHSGPRPAPSQSRRERAVSGRSGPVCAGHTIGVGFRRTRPTNNVARDETGRDLGPGASRNDDGAQSATTGQGRSTRPAGGVARNHAPHRHDRALNPHTTIGLHSVEPSVRVRGHWAGTSDHSSCDGGRRARD